MVEYSCENLPIGVQLSYNVVIHVGGKKKPTMNELLDNAKDELANLLSGEVFLLRDLFKGYEGNRISRSDRLLLGTLFLNYIKTDDIGLFRLKRLLGAAEI